MKRRLLRVPGRTTALVVLGDCGGCTEMPNIVLNAMARSLLNEVVVAFSLPSKVRAHVASASSVCSVAIASRCCNRALLCEAGCASVRLASRSFGGREVGAAASSCACFSPGSNECGKNAGALACLCLLVLYRDASERRSPVPFMGTRADVDGKGAFEPPV